MPKIHLVGSYICIPLVGRDSRYLRGEFTCLRFQNLINFQSDDANKYDCIRHEVLWFAPEIGRWVARESSGSYMVGGVGAVYLEGSHVWQLSAWK
jgi:hypothetical protein